MNWRIPFIAVGIILVLVASAEFVFGGALGALSECGLDFECYFADEIASLEISIVLLIVGVLSMLTSLTIGRRPGD